jgi:hypothetical protein
VPDEGEVEEARLDALDVAGGAAGRDLDAEPDVGETAVEVTSERRDVDGGQTVERAERETSSQSGTEPLDAGSSAVDRLDRGTRLGKEGGAGAGPGDPGWCGRAAVCRACSSERMVADTVDWVA